MFLSGMKGSGKGWNGGPDEGGDGELDIGWNGEPNEGGAAQRARTTKCHRRTLFETSSDGLKRPLTVRGRVQKAL